MEDNITRQAEEIEALCSIYGDKWCLENEASQSYSMTVSVEEGGGSVTLYVTLPADYPSHSPPLYQLSAPALSRPHKQELAGRLENIYLDNIGENILYQWAEAVKEFLEEKASLKSVENVEDGETLNDSIEVSNQEPESNVQVPTIIHGNTIVDRKSIFQGHVATITCVDQVKMVLSSLMENKKIANATHNIYAYRVQKAGGCLAQDCEDDGETAAGSRLLHLLQIMDVLDVVVVVSRWYGGVHLGPDRFRHINNAARQVLELSGLTVKKK